MSRMKSTKKQQPGAPATWDAALHALVGAQGQEAASAVALTTGLVLALRVSAPDVASPADLSAAQARGFLGELPRPLVPAGKDTLRALRRVAQSPHTSARRARRGGRS